jgi:DNA-binding MarR family transcriptional regulator
VVLVVLTPRGRRLVDRIFVELMRQEQALLSPLTRREREKLVVLLRRWLSWFEGRRSEPPDRG